jgi:hypothetical protein
MLREKILHIYDRLQTGLSALDKSKVRPGITAREAGTRLGKTTSQIYKMLAVDYGKGDGLVAIKAPGKFGHWNIAPTSPAFQKGTPPEGETSAVGESRANTNRDLQLLLVLTGHVADLCTLALVNVRATHECFMAFYRELTGKDLPTGSALSPALDPGKPDRPRPPIDITFGPPDGMDEAEQQRVVTAALASVRERPPATAEANHHGSISPNKA